MKKSFLGILTMFVSVLMFASCGASKQDVTSLVAGRWNIAEVNGEKITGEKTPFIEFDAVDKKLHGNAGCNNFNAAYKVDPAKPTSIQLLPAATTMMACSDMETERKVLKALDTVTSVKKTGTGLQLLNNSGAVVFLLDKAL